jgi:hypothetical protein
MAFNITVRTAYNRTQAFTKGDLYASAVLSKVHASWVTSGKQQGVQILRNLVPVKTGALRDSVVASDIPKGFSVFPTAKQAIFVEKGTAPHLITARPGSVLHWLDPDTGQDRFARHVHHPGTTAHPFMRKAADELRPILSQLYVDAWAEQA